MIVALASPTRPEPPARLRRSRLRRARVAASWLAAVVVLACWPARAAPAAGGTSPALVLHVGDGDGAGQLDALRRRLRIDPRFTQLRPRSVSRAAILAEIERQQDHRRLEAAQRRAREGWALLGHLERRRAIAQLTASLAGYAATQHLPGSCLEAQVVMRDLAYAHWQLHDRALAATALVPAARLSPAPLDPTRYPPPFVAFARQLPQPPPVQVRLQSDREGSTFQVNCERLGKDRQVEVTLAGVAMVRVANPQRRAWSTFVGRAGQRRVIAAQLVDVDLSSRPARETLVALARRGHATALVWRGRGDAIEIRVIDLASAAPGPWLALSRPRPTVRPVSAWRSLAGWSLVAGGAAALIAGTAFGVAARGAADRLEDAAAPGDRYYDGELASDESRRRSFGTAAYVLWGVGAAAAAGALVLWLTRPARPRGTERPRAARLRPAPGGVARHF